MSFSSDTDSLGYTTTEVYDNNTTTEYIIDGPVSDNVEDLDSDSFGGTTTTITVHDNATTTEYVSDQPVAVYVESDNLLPSYHNTVIYTDSRPVDSYVIESEDADCFCLGGLCAALFCCCAD